MAIRTSILAALGTKAAAGGAVAALVAGGAVATAAVTGSTNPMNWGQQVVQKVQDCKDDVRTSQSASAASASRGIGQCVSAFARQHGEQQRAEHSKGTPGSPNANPGRGQAGTAPTRGNGSGTVEAGDHSQGHASPPASPGPTTHGPGDHGRPTPTPTAG